MARRLFEVSYFALKTRKFAFCSCGIFLFVFLKTFKAPLPISTPFQVNQFFSCGFSAFTPLTRPSSVTLYRTGLSYGRTKF